MEKEQPDQKENGLKSIRLIKEATSSDQNSFVIILITAFLLPLFFFPYLTLEASKAALTFGAVLVAFFLWLISRLRDGEFIFPRSLILLSGAGIPLVYLISALFARVPSVSLVGIGFDVGTASTAAILFLLMFVSSIVFQDKRRALYLLYAIFGAAFALIVFQVFRYGLIAASGMLPSLQFFSGVLDFLQAIHQNLIGKWNDWTIFFGFISVLSLSTLEFLPLTKGLRTFLYTLLILSLLVMAAVGFSLAWLILGFFALILFVYSIAFLRMNGGESNISTKRRVLPTASFAILLISLFFVIANEPIREQTFRFLGIPSEILRPTWGQTFSMSADALRADPVLGAGPNTFGSSWLLHKPEGVNNSILWAVDFDAGVGLIPSMAVSTGILGILAWLAFLGIFLYRGFRAIFSAGLDRVTHYLLFTSFFGALYLWVLAFLYVPNVTVFSLAFLMTGVSVAMFLHAGVVKNYRISYLGDPRIGFISVLALIVLILSSAAWGYFLFGKFLGAAYFGKGTAAVAAEDAERDLVRAVRWNEFDAYYRALADRNLAIAVGLASSAEPNRDEVNRVLQRAIEYALRATEENGTNYLNWFFLARSYELLISFGFAEGYDLASKAYEEALARNPQSPAIVLAQARLEIARKNTDGAKEYIARALNLKNNYTEAIFLLSQIQADEGNLADAIVSAEVVALTEPNDVGAFFHLGFLRYKNEDYRGAIDAFREATRLNPNYANAMYFLGLSYYEEGEREKAIAEFTRVSELNPDNAEARSILRNLRAGRSPFAGQEEVQEPEDRETPPIAE